MTDQPTEKPALSPEELEKKKAKKEKKKKDKILSREKIFLGFERTLLAWVRTSTNLLTFGFAIIKLLKDKSLEPGKHPLLEVINPVMVGTVMIFAGFMGLLLASLSYVKYGRIFGRTSRQIFLSQSMLVAYVIMALSFLILIAPLLAKMLS